MKKTAGVWIDHKEAVIILITSGAEQTKLIISNGEKHIRYSGSAHSKTPEGSKEVSAEDQRDRKFTNQLNKYYDEVFAAIRDAETVQIFGPGEAKGELKKRLEHAGYKGNILPLESADKMTDHQIAEKVREQFPS
jgi:hypothetical protein